MSIRGNDLIAEKTQKGNLSEKLTLLFMLAAIFVALSFGLESWINNLIKLSHESVIRQRRFLSNKIAAQTEAKQYTIRNTLPLLPPLAAKHNLDLHAIREDYRNKRGLDLNLYQFDSLGNLVQTAPAPAPNLWLMRNLYAAFKEKNVQNVSKMRKGLDKKVEFSFGFGKDLNSIRDYPETIIETTFNDQNGFIAWTCRAEGGVIITCSQQPDEKAVFSQIHDQIKAEKDLKLIGLLDTDQTRTGQLAAEAKKNLDRNSSDSGEFGNHYWVFAATAAGKTIYTAFSPIPAPYQKLLNMGRLILACCLAAILIFFLTARAQAILSLKRLVISLFFASSFVPLSAIAFTSIENIDVYRQIHTNKLRAAKEETLRNIIQNFSSHASDMSQKLMAMTSDPGNGNQDPKTIKMADTISEAFPEARIYLRNAAGETIFSNAVEISPGRETVMKSLARRMVERFAPERIDEVKYNGNIFADSMVRKDDMGFGTLINYPNRIQLVGTGNTELLLFFRMIPQGKSRCAVVLLEFSTIETLKRYLAAIQSRPSIAENISLQISAFYPKGFRWTLPPLQKHEKTVLTLAQIAAATGKAQFQHILPENLFALSIPSSELSGNCLTAFCSAEPLDENIFLIKQRIAIGSLLAIFLVAAIGLWLSRQLITPLQNLEKGIVALSERRFETRIPAPPGKDELTQLFHAFNDMMAESYDMQIAHNVQEGLVPAKFPDIEGYSNHGLLRAASDLGGDCLDCFTLPDGNLLFLVGDITGHGVGSALIMAFARAVTFHWSMGAELSPANLTDQIDSMLRKNLTERMFMGIICGVLNLKTHVAEIVTKGHIYPLIIRADGSKEWRGMPAYPLGIGKQQPAETCSVSFGEGDSILCITDGFLESYNRNLRAIGFDGVEVWASEHFSSDAKEWVENLEKQFRAWCDDNQSDDISIFAINRLKEGSGQ